jgi:hypothetical protein
MGLVLLATLFMWRALMPGNALLPLQLISRILPWSNSVDEPMGNYLVSDPFFSFYPRRFFFTTTIRSNQLPLWNPYMLGGYPAVGDINAQTFYPPNWLVVQFAAPARSFALLAWFHLGLTGVLMYGFLRGLNLRRLAALLGGIAWMLNGVTVVWLENPQRLSSATWLPGVFWLFELSLQRRRASLAAGAGLLFGLMVLGGQPQYTLLGGLYLAGYGLLRALEWNEGRLCWSWYPFKALAIVAGAGLMLGSPQLLPALEFTGQSQRRIAPVARWLRTRWPLRHTIALWAPDFFGTVVPGRRLYWGSLNYAEYTFYFGVAPFLLAVAAPILCRTRAAWFLGVMAGLTALVGWGSPLAWLAHQLPGMALFSLHRMLSLLPFLGSWLAALALDAIACRRGNMGVVLAVAALLVALTAIGLYVARLEVRMHWSGVWPELVRSALILGAGLVILALARQWPNLAVTGLVLLTCLDLLQWGMPFNPVASEDLLYPEGAVVEWLRKESGHHRVLPLQRRSHMFDVFGPNILSLYRLSTPTGYCAQLIRHHRELLYTIDPFHPEEPQNLAGPHPNLVISQDFQQLHSLLSVRFVLSSELLPTTETGLRLVGTLEGVHIYENPTPLPRAYVVHRTRVAGPEGALALLEEDTFDFRSSVVLESPLTADHTAELAMTPENSNSCVEIVRYEPNRVELEVKTDHAGLLVLTDPYYPGWRATVDREDASIHRVNHDLRGVFVPAGTHDVIFTFRPITVLLGAALATVSLVVAVVIIVVERRKSMCATPFAPSLVQ